MTTKNYLDRNHFTQVLNDAINQVFEGKGLERHGRDIDFKDQPWRIISDNVGSGFSLGQAMKKLMELKVFDTDTNYRAWRREALGAIVYTAMAIMYMDKETSFNQPTPVTVREI